MQLSLIVLTALTAIAAANPLLAPRQDQQCGQGCDPFATSNPCPGDCICFKTVC
jgi:hypothetical protein